MHSVKRILTTENRTCAIRPSNMPYTCSYISSFVSSHLAKYSVLIKTKNT